jgi:hypothetical protein
MPALGCYVQVHNWTIFLYTPQFFYFDFAIKDFIARYATIFLSCLLGNRIKAVALKREENIPSVSITSAEVKVQF